MTTQGPLRLRVEVEKWPLKAPFRITNHTFINLEAVVVRLERNGAVGWGEAAGVYYRNDNAVHIVSVIEGARARIEAGVDRESLRHLLPAGGARNAVDCALWDLEAKLLRQPAWKIAGLSSVEPLVTTFTVGADSPENMAAGAVAYTHARAIKLKLTGESNNAERVRAVRAARPDVWLGIDANQGLNRQSLEALLPALVECNVQLIEQPFPVGHEADLDGLRSPIPIAADESVQDAADVALLAGRFNVINIKLDKCGGLTEGFAVAREAQRYGLDVMVGNMTATALGTAPALLLGQLCKIVDQDGAIFLREDRTPPTRYENGTVWCSPSTWGAAESP